MQTVLFNILVFIIVAIASFLAIRKVVNHFYRIKDQSCSSSCESCSAECQL